MGKSNEKLSSSAIKSKADHACIVSWNELHEGTQIEPTREHGLQYIHLSAHWTEVFRKS